MPNSEATVYVIDTGGVRRLIAAYLPVNALGYALRSLLDDELAAAERDPAVRAVVIEGADGAFFAGADIREFGTPPKSPRIFDLISRIDSMSKPVIAAIAGRALGGGLELALGCHGRIATETAEVGFPEIRLGLIPGAGGTQRLPRLTGLARALELMSSGSPISTVEARDLGIVDRLSSTSLASDAVAFADDLAGRPVMPRRVRDLDPPSRDADFDKAAERLIGRSRGQAAPVALIVALSEAAAGNFESGLAVERAAFEGLRSGDQSRAMRHNFAAERQARKAPGIDRDTPRRAVRRIGIIGGGTMGRGIAIACLAAGLEVQLADPSQDATDAARSAIRSTLERDRDKGRISADQCETRLANLSVRIGSAAELGAVDLVIEAALEDLALKTSIFADLGARPGGPILATNTSTLDVDVIANASGRPEEVLGLHFFSPANIMKLLEVVRGARTSVETLATGLDFARAIGKIPVVVGVCDGFVGNRMLAQRHLAAERLLLDGALPEQVDAAWEEYGFPMGPFRMTDLAGLDTNWRVRQARGVPLAIHDRLYEMGRYGQKSGLGFYRYAEGSRRPEDDPAVKDLILATSESLGIRRRTIDDDEILDRLLLPMINEAARILEEGIASQASDIDVIWVHGYGWPAWQGGPMFHADRMGLPRVRDRLEALSEALQDDRLAPVPLLRHLAQEERGFLDWHPRMEARHAR